MALGQTRIGLSGYSYRPWQGPDRFYPPTLKPVDFLPYYATRYRTVELDGTWYRLPSESMIEGWIASTPSDFLFVPKAHRRITHLQRLKLESLPAVQVMLERLEPLRSAGRLGPILLQLPPNLKRDDDRLEGFLRALPKVVRWAVEFRHDSWNVDEVEVILRSHAVAWVAADTDERPAQRRDSADFRYVRLRRSAYDRAMLSEWATWLRQGSGQPEEAFVFVKHEDEGSPWLWADQLVELTRK